ncbi:MAG: beta-galactosidase trimerization domain-containing protein, partial [Candidatus Hydrogenedentes bacterium]|nr:beta-galactosidase trimerization domain-containing protein [Candidatus Hydrogenedentota bacterium]
MTHRARPSAVVLFQTCFALGLCFLVAAQENEEERKGWNFLEDQLSLAADCSTPHTAWAKPYAGGTIRVQFFAPWFQGSTDPREIVELMQRFDIDGQAAYLMGNRLVGDGHPDWYGDDAEAGTKRALAFLDKGVDAIFVNQLTLDTLPAALRERVYTQVAAGAGLVLVGEKAVSPEGAQPLASVPEGLAQGAYYTLGKGRIVVLPSRSKLEYRLGWETEFDYQMQEQGRVLLWAANRLPTASITIQAPAVDHSVFPADTIGISTAGLSSDTTIRVTLRRGDGITTDLGTVAAGDSASRLSLPRLRAGEYHVNCIAAVNGRVLTWATTPLTITANRNVDTVELRQDWAEAGDRVAGIVRVTGPLERADRLELRLVDSCGRILRRQVLAAAPDAVPFLFTVPAWAPMLLRVEAVLMDKDGDVSSASAYLRVTTRNRHQFNFVMWNFPGGDLAPYGVESMVRYGVTAFLQGGPPPLFLAAHQAAYVPYAASFRASSHTLTAMLDPDTGLLKSGCVHDPEAMRKSIEDSVEGVRGARQHGVLAYSLGDENAVRASCLGPKCLEAYRHFLREIYGDIGALNQEWDSTYASFQEIELLTEGPLPAPDAPAWFREYFDERQTLHRTDNEGAKGETLERQIELGNINDEMRALQQDNFARWYDRQAFQCYTYVQWCKQYQDAFRSIDPQAWTGFEGTDSFTLRKHTTRSRQGGDLDAFVRELDYYGSYEGPGNEVMRSIGPKGFPMGSWIGYTPDVEELLFKYWQQVADRMNTIQWWRWDNLEGYNGYLAPNLAPFPATRELFDDTQVVRDGLGALIMESEMQDDGIAMLYSMPSTHIAHFDGNDTYGLYKRDHDRWHQLLHGEGFQFRYVTDRMLRLGEFDDSRCKVLLLPLAFAMSPAEAEYIRDFVQRGGTVIADVRPALYDGHCKPLAHGLLNDVFGIDQTGNRAARDIDRMSVDGQLEGESIAMRWGNWHGKDIYPAMKVEPNVALTTGKALGDAAFIHYWTGLRAPVCIVNEYGKGRAVLLNFSVFDAPCAPLLRGLLAAAGVTPAIQLSVNGRAPKDVEISRWRTGEIEFFTLLGTKTDEDVRVSLAQPGRLYDMKRHLDLGYAAEFTARLRPNRGSVFAVLPSAPESPRINLPGKARAGSVVNANISIPHAQGAHAINVKVTRPDGQDSDWLRQPLLAASCPAAITLPFAY